MGFILSAAASRFSVANARLISRPFSIFASKSTRPVRKIDTSTPRKQQQAAQPSVAEVKRAIGVADDSFGAPAGASSSDSSSDSSSSSSSSPFLRFLEKESAAERKLRQTAEWMVERTEANEQPGLRILLLVCLYILPLWIFLLLIASGVAKLPFDLPYWNDLLS